MHATIDRGIGKTGAYAESKLLTLSQAIVNVNEKMLNPMT